MWLSAPHFSKWESKGGTKIKPFFSVKYNPTTSLSHFRILPRFGTQHHQVPWPHSGGWSTQSQSQWSCGPVEERERRLLQTFGGAHSARAGPRVLVWLRRGCGWLEWWRVGNYSPPLLCERRNFCETFMPLYYSGILCSYSVRHWPPFFDSDGKTSSWEPLSSTWRTETLEEPCTSTSTRQEGGKESHPFV